MYSKYDYLTIENFNEYIKRNSYCSKNYNGFYIQNNNKFLVSIKTNLYEKFKESLIRRRAEIIAEHEKIVNKQFNRVFMYVLIDCKKYAWRKSARALFKKYNLVLRKTRVLNKEYRKNWNE